MAASIEGARERLVFCHLLKIPAFDAMTDKPVIPNSLDIAAGLNNQDRRTRPVKQMKHACEVAQFNFNRKLCYRVVHLGSDSHGLKNGTRNGTRIHTKAQFEKEICTNYFFLIVFIVTRAIFRAPFWPSESGMELEY